MTDQRRRVGEFVSNLTFKALPGDDPGVLACFQAYLTKMGLSTEEKSTAERWYGIFDGEQLIGTFGERTRAERTLEVTDLYPHPDAGRKGTLAVYGVLAFLKRLTDMGFIDNVVAVVLAKNDDFRKVAEKSFALPGPTAVFYMYGKG